MQEMNFDDLLFMRKGGANLTMGGEPSRIEKICTPQIISECHYTPMDTVSLRSRGEKPMLFWTAN